jgi:hypothetical protein
MRPLLHFLSFALMLPSLIFASGFLLLGHAIGGGSLFAFFSRLLSDALWLASGGLLLVLALLCAILIGGFVTRTRFLAAACVAALSVGSAAVLVALGAGGWLLLVPGLVSVCASGWLAIKEWPRVAALDAGR